MQRETIEWVPVSEGLPPYSSRWDPEKPTEVWYLVTMASGRVDIVSDAWLNGYGGRKVITAWAELPRGYQNEA